MSDYSSKLFSNQSKIESVSQVMFSISSSNQEETFSKVQSIALNWVERKAKRSLPDKAWKGEPFDLIDIGAQRAMAASFPSKKYWACRVDDADKNIAQRTWMVEISLAIGDKSPGKVLFGCKLRCISMGDLTPYTPTIPKIVSDVVSQNSCFLDGNIIATAPWNIANESDVNNLIKFLNKKSRNYPVVVISLGDKGGRDSSGVIDASELIRKTIGTLHVVTITGDASYILSDMLGKEFSVFHSAVRTYLPGFDSHSDNPYMHPLALPEKIKYWDGIGSSAFLDFITRQTLKNSVSSLLEKKLPSFNEIRELTLKKSREDAIKEGSSDKELLEMAMEEIESLKNKQKEDILTYEGLLKETEKDKNEISEERNQFKENCNALRARLLHLESQARINGSSMEPEIPNSLGEIEDWCRKHLSGSIVILPRAIHGAKKADFSNMQMIYKTLLLMRNHYVPMKREGGKERRRVYDNELSKLNLEESKCFSESRKGEFEDHYRVIYKGKSRFLDMHYKGCDARNEQHCFRLYFFWDDDDQLAVVGWFPTHLPTRVT